LIEPITAEQPCGENLEDTQLLASFDAFRLFGQPMPLEPAPEWGEIRSRALEALGKSKDLRLLAHLGSAVLRTDGLPAFSETLRIASQWLDTYWSGTYPLVDEDAIVRRNALNCFADQVAVVDGLRRVPLVSTRQHGRFSLRDIDMATGQVQPGEADARPEEGQIDAAFAAMPLDELRLLHQSAEGALAALKSIDARMRSEAGPAAAPSFDPLSAQLVKVDRVLRAQLATRHNGDGADTTGSDSGDDGATAAAIGVIRSRRDAIRALDAVADFFRQTEPSSPIPMLLERAKRLVAKNFLEVLADIAPEALGQARAAGGLRDGE
jgi:type VI secretion system protein ImpA